MPAQGRPRRADRGRVASTTLSLRITPPEREGLERLALKRQAELQAMYGPGAAMSMAGVVRSLIAAALEADASHPKPEPQRSEDELRRSIANALDLSVWPSPAHLATAANAHTARKLTRADVDAFINGEHQSDDALNALLAALSEVKT